MFKNLKVLFKKMMLLIETSLSDEKYILPFLNALYGINQTESSVYLPNGFWESDMGTENYDALFSGLGNFIKKYQHLLIRNESDKQLNNKKENIKNLAEEGTKKNLLSVGSPHVATAMIQSAFATAIATSKGIFNEFVANNKETATSDKKTATPEEQNTENIEKAIEATRQSHMFYNSGLIINMATVGFKNIVEQVKESSEAVFDTAWSVIPFDDCIPSTIQDQLYSFAGGVFSDGLNVDENSVSSLKDNMTTEFSKLLLAYLNNLKEVDFGKKVVDFSALEEEMKEGYDSFNTGLNVNNS